jgi:polysaccharide pyruvyl transferase WcaK-like protein
MKVGLLTFHNALNHGAALQVYALQQTIKDMGADCEIIDYVNEHRKNCYNMINYAEKELKKKNIGSAIKYCIGSLFMGRRRQQFSKFYNKYLHCTDICFASSEEAKMLNGKFDKFIVGSDQVWNHNNDGIDFAFFLDFVDEDNKKIAYAPSFGLMTIPEDLKSAYGENIGRIKYLSARESYGVQLIKDLTGRKAELVLDPVFLLSKKKWLSLYSNTQKKKKYIFCYTNRSNQWKDFLEQTRFSIKEYEIYKLTSLTIKDFINPKVKINFSISPAKFIEVMASAELIVSASFHCIAMSIILNIPFVAILTGDQGKDERLLNMLRITGLESRILNGKMTLNDVNKPIDFPRVEKKLEEYRNKSISFLKNAIFT